MRVQPSMPLIKVQASISKPQGEIIANLLKSLSIELARHLNKPEFYVMTAFEADIPMTFAGSRDPACYVEIKSVGSITSAQSKAMSQDFCHRLEQALGIPQNRIYIEFCEVKGTLWGWNGSTFA